MKFEAVKFGSDDKLQTIFPGLLHVYKFYAYNYVRTYNYMYALV